MYNLLFVCRGNTCRSAMAQAMAEHLYARYKRVVGSGAEPMQMRSAGLDAYDGMPASSSAITVMQEIGIDLRKHRSQRLSRMLVDGASEILVMTSLRRSGVRQAFPSSAGKLRLLDGFGGDIPDPIGDDIGAYRETVRSLDKALRSRFLALGLSPF